ncbi:MAG: hypothetical protein ABFS56_32300 [Pseudomonadota bacterium]
MPVPKQNRLCGFLSAYDNALSHCNAPAAMTVPTGRLFKPLAVPPPNQSAEKVIEIELD